MKNITVTIDDETHRRARIRAAELGTSVSALVKGYLMELADGPPIQAQGVQEMQSSFKAESAAALSVLKAAPLATDAMGPPYFVDGKSVYTKDGKPRKPGALRHLGGGWTPEFDEWPEGFIDAMYGEDTEAANNWWKPFAKPPAKIPSK